jgi:hypothetical protein
MSLSMIAHTLLEDWTQFERCVLPADFGIEQRRKAKFAYYTGALRVIERFMEAQPTDADAAVPLIMQMQIEAQALANSIVADLHKSTRDHE